MDEIEIQVFGRVQGINLRNITKRFCDGHKIKGYVMNRDDGSVFIVAQGEKKSLEELLSWLSKNPGFSKVAQIQHLWKPVHARYADFSIVHEHHFVVDQAKSMVQLGKSFLVDNKSKIPQHVVIIPDGNRRWARERGLHATFGHYTAGSKDHIVSLIEEAGRLKIPYITFWGFSTENWKRDNKEIKAIFNLILNNVGQFKKMAAEQKVRFRHLGRKDRLPKNLLAALEELERETKKYDRINVQLCLDYGGCDEIIRAVNKLLSEGVKQVDEEAFKKYLDTVGIPDPDLIIRTSGEQRTSGMMAFQSGYAELYFSDVYFPDFDVAEFRKAVSLFGKRVRRFGATAKEDLIASKQKKA
jgi:undecaprenyl diphosphate synthase